MFKINGEHVWVVKGLAVMQKYPNEKLGRVRTWPVASREAAIAKAQEVTSEGAVELCEHALIEVRRAGSGVLWTVVQGVTGMQADAVAATFSALQKHARAWADYQVLTSASTVWINRGPADALELLTTLEDNAASVVPVRGRSMVGKVRAKVAPLAAWVACSPESESWDGTPAARLEVLPAGTTPEGTR